MEASDSPVLDMGAFRRVVKQFDLGKNHRTIYEDPNELIKAGFSAEFLLPLIGTFRSSASYVYYCRGEIIAEMIGISHLSLVYAIGRRLGVPEDTGRGFTGSGFAMQSVIDAINAALKD